MREDAHEQHALQIEHAITVLGDPAADPDLAVTVIECYWAAAFHWVAYGCQRKHGEHKENHTQLGRYLRDLGEPSVSTLWDDLEASRQGAMYAYRVGKSGLHVPWLDPETAADVIDIVQSVAQCHPEVQAAILFGSVARHDERPLDDPEPSDVDLFLLLDASVMDPKSDRLTHPQELALRRTIGDADYRHHTAPREVKVVFVYRTLADWDSSFIENVARDGILLWTRAPLPEALAPVTERTLDSLTTSAAEG